MDSQEKQRCRAYRFTLTAVSFGKVEDEALENLFECLGEPAVEILDGSVVFEALDYVYIVREDIVAEA